MSWWTSTSYNNSNLLYAIEGGQSSSTGSILTKTYDYTLGVRPHICIDTSLSGSATEETVTLAGTWIMNDTLIDLDTSFDEKINCKMVTKSGYTYDLFTISTLKDVACTFDESVSGQTRVVARYLYPSNTWDKAYNEIVREVSTLTFSEGTTCSDEFFTWLKANATKQS